MPTPEETYDGSRPLPKRTHLYQYELVNSPDNSIIGFLVEFPPKGAMPPHRHAAASVTGCVLEGSIFNRMNEETVRDIAQNGTWYEAPGCHHRMFQNSSSTEKAKVIATYVVETKVVAEGGFEALTIVDEECREAHRKAMSR